jgi:Heavy metal binding domain
MRTDQYFRIGLAIFFAAPALAAPSWGCASEQKPRPVAIDPSNPTASESEPLRVAALSPSPETPPSASQTPGEPVGENPVVPSSAEDHAHDHPGNVAPKGNPKAGEAGKTGKAGKQQGTIYTCPMHPEVISDKPGRCPKCGMNLVPKEPAEGKK